MFRLEFLKLLLEGAPVYFPGLDFKTRKKRINEVLQLFETLDSPVYYVLGNHELKFKVGLKAFNNYHGYKVWLKELFAENYYYSWDCGGYHFVCLNSNENYSPVLTEIFAPKIINGGCFTFSEKQLLWLKSDLSKTKKPTIIFTHIPLDNRSWSSYDIINNAKEARNIIFESNKVLAVIQAHSHHMSAPNLNGYTVKFKKIPYIYLPSFGSKVIGPRHSIVRIGPEDKKIHITTRKVEKNWERKRKVAIPKTMFDQASLKPIEFSVINDIHYGPKRWDLYDEAVIQNLLQQFITDTNLLKPKFVVVNGDWIDGHM